MTGLLAALTDVAPVYEIPDDDLIGEVIVPAMSHADEVWVGSGYFSSHCLAQVAPALADFIERSEAPLKLLISPQISSTDRAAIKKSVTTEQDLADRLAEEIFEGGAFSESALVEHTRECFAYPIAAGRAGALSAGVRSADRGRHAGRATTPRHRRDAGADRRTPDRPAAARAALARIHRLAWVARAVEGEAVVLRAVRRRREDPRRSGTHGPSQPPRARRRQRGGGRPPRAAAGVERFATKELALHSLPEVAVRGTAAATGLGQPQRAGARRGRLVLGAGALGGALGHGLCGRVRVDAQPRGGAGEPSPAALQRRRVSYKGTKPSSSTISSATRR